MISFDGIYRLRGPAARRKLGGNMAAAWRVRIIDYTLGTSGVCYLKPYTLVAVPAEDGIFKGTCAEALGRRICRDFDLDVGRVTWIERLPGIENFLFVAVFTPNGGYEPWLHYKIEWRSIRANEIAAIKDFIPEAEQIEAPRPACLSSTSK